MQVSTTTSLPPSTSASPTSADSPSASLDYDDFLQLLMAEMQNQDPTDPMDTSEYIAQFAAFSTVEQVMQTNAKLDAMLTSSALAQADSVIGHTVTSGDGTVTGVVASLKITSDGPLATLTDGQQLILGEGVTIS
jgi:flagellar basal-body rod modification protein FlgD